MYAECVENARQATQKGMIFCRQCFRSPDNVPDSDLDCILDSDPDYNLGTNLEIGCRVT